MITLPNGCKCSELTVTPKDWKTCKSPTAMARSWHIQYYFYDTFLNKRKFVRIKGMNRFKVLAERREATAQLIQYPILNKSRHPSRNCTILTGYIQLEPILIVRTPIKKLVIFSPKKAL